MPLDLTGVVQRNDLSSVGAAAGSFGSASLFARNYWHSRWPELKSRRPRTHVNAQECPELGGRRKGTDRAEALSVAPAHRRTWRTPRGSTDLRSQIRVLLLPSHVTNVIAGWDQVILACFPISETQGRVTKTSCVQIARRGGRDGRVGMSPICSGSARCESRQTIRQRQWCSDQGLLRLDSEGRTVFRFPRWATLFAPRRRNVTLHRDAHGNALMEPCRGPARCGGYRSTWTNVTPSPISGQDHFAKRRR